MQHRRENATSVVQPEKAIRAELDISRLQQQFERYGYMVLPEVLDLQRCQALLQLIICSFSQLDPDFIISPDFRVHSPLPMNELTKTSIKEIVGPVYPILDQFLSENQTLVELSSITVFPHADAQRLHPDESNPGKYLVSIFVNLAPTHTDSGALWIVPGSHKDLDTAHTIDEAIPVELPMGSVVFMNSKTWHCGGGNQSLERIRPVFYFSFGDDDLKGPTYSIRSSVRALDSSLHDYRSQFNILVDPWQESSIPLLAEDIQLLTSLSEPKNKDNDIFMVRNGVFLGEIPQLDAWAIEALHKISRNKKQTLASMANEIHLDQSDKLLNMCTGLEKAGYLRKG